MAKISRKYEVILSDLINANSDPGIAKEYGVTLDELL
jgi:hypothetical protein